MPEPETHAKTTSTPVDQQSVEQFVRSIIASNGSAEAAVRALGRDNLRLRRKNNELKDEVAGYQTRNPQGSVVLVGEDVTLWNTAKPVIVKLKEANIAVTDIPKILDDKTKLEQEVAAGKRKNAARTAAQELKFDADVFEDLIDTKGLVLEKKKVTVQVDGKVESQDKWHVRPAADAAAAFVLIEDSPQLKPYLRALGTVVAGGGDDGQDADNEEVTTSVPTQGKSGKAADKKDVAKAVISRYASPSELRKKE